jgi:hypothetical protein
MRVVRGFIAGGGGAMVKLNAGDIVDAADSYFADLVKANPDNFAPETGPTQPA